jgi:hypothetical protein
MLEQQTRLRLATGYSNLHGYGSGARLLEHLQDRGE